MASESQNRDAPPFLAKKSAFFAQFRPIFTKNGGASRFWLSDVTEPNYPLDPTQNYNRTLAFLKIPPSGRDLGAFLTLILAKKLNFGQILVFLALNSSNCVLPQV